MPVVVPSQIVILIDRAFPWAAHPTPAGVLVATHAPSVGGFVSLIDRLDSGVLSALSPDEHTALLAAAAALRTSLEMWNSPAHVGLQHRLNPSAEFGGFHALQVVRRALAACPDDSARLANTELTFMGDPAFEHILLQDVSTASSALANGEFKAAAVMAGSVVEAVLLWAIRRRAPGNFAIAWTSWQAARAATGAPPPPALAPDVLRWTLEQVIEIARHLPIVSEATAVAATITRNYRNLIHPGRAERLSELPSLGSAHLCVGAMRLVIDDVRARVIAGTL